MNLGVVGAGYVGLVAAACFAETGNDVICVDIDSKKIERLRNGEIPIYEPGLEALVGHSVEKGQLSFTTDMRQMVEHADVIFIAVGTPQDQDGSADLQYVLSVAQSIGRFMRGQKIIVNKSTVPVGTASLVAEEIRKYSSEPFHVVSNPEFLKEGSAIEDFMKPDRVVIGADHPEAAEVMAELYGPFLRTGKPILHMGVRSAEVTKYAANALLATKVTFMNEIARFCEEVGADVSEVRQGVGSDARIGSSFLFPGVGYGGSCFPKDVRALIRKGEDSGVPMEIVAAVDRVNERQKQHIVNKVIKHFGGEENIRGLTFALWGLSFKPRTDDMREAPSLTVISGLTSLGAKVQAYDPEAMEVASAIFAGRENDVILVDRSYQALEGADALIIVTEWNEFRQPNFPRMKSLLKSPVIFDGRNLYSRREMGRQGFTYYSIGRVPVCSGECGSR